MLSSLQRGRSSWTACKEKAESKAPPQGQPLALRRFCREIGTLVVIQWYLAKTWKPESEFPTLCLQEVPLVPPGQVVLQAPIARLAPVAPFVLQRLRSVSRCLQWWEIGGRNEASRQLSTLAKAERWPSIIIMDHCSEIQYCCFPKSEDWNAQMHQFCQSLILSQLKWPGSRPYPDIAIWQFHSDWVAMAGQTTNHQWSSNSLAWKGGWMDWRIFTTFSLAACTLYQLPKDRTTKPY
jgi:hypothetical protein